MLQKDYILEIVGDFVDGVAKHLDAALAGDAEATGAVEQDVAGLLDLDPEVALTLSPDSLVTMMVLSGMGDSVAADAGLRPHASCGRLRGPGGRRHGRPAPRAGRCRRGVLSLRPHGCPGGSSTPKPPHGERRFSPEQDQKHCEDCKVPYE